MADKNIDRLLNINTSPIIHWYDKISLDDDYFESEPTDYRDIEELFTHYQPNKKRILVDVGCGTGRLVFWLNYYFDQPVTGIEYHPQTFQLLQSNLQSYQEAHPNKSGILIENQAAEDYQIQADQEIFYFFNPFKVSIYIEVIENILKSAKEHPRDIDLILYYPVPAISQYMNLRTPFRMIDSINLPWYSHNQDRFDIYRLEKEHN